MREEIRDFRINPNHTEQEWEEKVAAFIKEIEDSGGRVVGAEPIGYVKFIVTGRRFTVKYDEA